MSVIEHFDEVRKISGELVMKRQELDRLQAKRCPQNPSWSRKECSGCQQDLPNHGATAARQKREEIQAEILKLKQGLESIVGR